MPSRQKMRNRRNILDHFSTRYIHHAPNPRARTRACGFCFFFVFHRRSTDRWESVTTTTTSHATTRTPARVSVKSLCTFMVQHRLFGYGKIKARTTTPRSRPLALAWLRHQQTKNTIYTHITLDYIHVPWRQAAAYNELVFKKIKHKWAY